MGLIKQRVTITATLEVDVEDWNNDYGNGTSATEIRQDVKAYAKNLLQQSNDNWNVVSFK
jgi:hypothetical protein